MFASFTKTTKPLPVPPAPLPPVARDGTNHSIQGVFEPPSGLVLSAIARHKLIICLLAVVFAAGGIAFGLSRQRIYTASTTLQVGQVNPNSPGFYGYVQSAASLATAFSRAIDAEPVLATVQQKLRLPPSKASARLSAEPIPVSPAFRVIATGPTESAAIKLANVATGAVIAYEGASNSANPEAASLLHDYREASLHLRRVVARLSSLSQDKATSADVLDLTEAEKSAAIVKLKAIAAAYVGAVSSQAPRSGLVSLVAGATSATSDRRSKVELLGFIGLLAGIVAGCLVAIPLERRSMSRRLAAGGAARVQRSEPAT